jgi:putative phosphoribosyl transferase
VQGLRIGYFGSSTGGGAARVAAAARPDHIAQWFPAGGRLDLAGAALGAVRAPTLLIVGGEEASAITSSVRSSLCRRSRTAS